MLDVWFWELVGGFRRMFTQPFLYIAILMGWTLSMRRIKKERASFGTRIFGRFSEWKGTWASSLVAGSILSIFALAGGMVLSFPLLLVISLILLLLSLPRKLNWYSSSYTIGLTSLILLGIPFLPEKWRTFEWVRQLEETPFTALALMLTVFLFVEAVLLLKTPSAQTYPERIKGKRGMWIGQHRGRKMAIIPFFALLPSGAIEPFAEWWPLLSIGGESYGMILIPFVLGWEWVTRAQAPTIAAKTMGRHMFLVALLVLMLTIVSFYISILSLAAVAVSLIGRILIKILHRFREEKPAFFSSSPKGIRVLGVIPGSPGSQMGLMPGELIERVNGWPVRSEHQFYEALQNSGAFTKMEVRDEWGEKRYVQRAMYEGEHYELGLVFIEPPTHESSVGSF